MFGFGINGFKYHVYPCICLPPLLTSWLPHVLIKGSQSIHRPFRSNPWLLYYSHVGVVVRYGSGEGKYSIKIQFRLGFSVDPCT